MSLGDQQNKKNQEPSSGSKKKRSHIKKKLLQQIGAQTFSHYCPGCRKHHHFRTNRTVSTNGYRFNGSLSAPTVYPTVRHSETRPLPAPDKGESIHTRCHYTISNGVLHFHPDSVHGLAGQSVPMPSL
jgi:cytochrome c1